MSSSPMTLVTVDLEEEAVFTEDVVVTATRTGQGVQDLPLRVEVMPQEGIDEKLFMTPGDVSMMLTETNGLRVQVTSLSGANVTISVTKPPAPSRPSRPPPAPPVWPQSSTHSGARIRLKSIK